jgi:hypothetical protein
MFANKPAYPPVNEHLLACRAGEANGTQPGSQLTLLRYADQVHRTQAPIMFNLNQNFKHHARRVAPHVTPAATP